MSSQRSSTYSLKSISRYSLSAVLLSDFTSELRECSSAAISINDISLPPIQSIPDALRRIHRSFLVEMGDDPAALDTRETRLRDESVRDDIDMTSSDWQGTAQGRANSVEGHH